MSLCVAVINLQFDLMIACLISLSHNQNYPEHRQVAQCHGMSSPRSFYHLVDRLPQIRDYCYPMNSYENRDLDGQLDYLYRYRVYRDYGEQVRLLPLLI